MTCAEDWQACLEPRILAANFNAHARFQFTVRVCGERVEASVYDPDSDDLR